jgi:hypothetical protein
MVVDEVKTSGEERRIAPEPDLDRTAERRREEASRIVVLLPTTTLAYFFEACGFRLILPFIICHGGAARLFGWPDLLTWRFF